MKGSGIATFTLIADALDASQMPAYVRSPGQLTDGHLLQLARVGEARLVTLDRGIPGAEVIA